MSFAVSGGASLGYTSNVALTRRDQRDDSFLVANAALSWSPHLGGELAPSLGIHASMFRYNKTSALDFQSVGFGAGLAWNPRKWPGVGFFGRYEFTDLLSKDGTEILQDHSFILGAQKTIALGRAHALSFGIAGVIDFSTPGAAERDQLSGFVGYHLQLSRKLNTDVLFRPAANFYNNSNRIDFNQLLSWNLTYEPTTWAQFSASLSYGANRSNHSVYDYNVLGGVAGIGAAVHY